MNLEEALVESCNKVYNVLGFGLMETTYEKALIYELRSRGVTCDNEVYINLDYEDNNGDSFILTSLRMDVVIYRPEKLVLELKTVKSLLKKDDKEYYQVKRYERLLGDTRGSYLINFGIKGLEIYRTTGEEYESLI